MRTLYAAFLVGLGALCVLLPQRLSRLGTGRPVFARSASARPSDPEIAAMVEKEVNRRLEEAEREGPPPIGEVRAPVLERLAAAAREDSDAATERRALAEPSTLSALSGWRPSRQALLVASTVAWTAPLFLLLFAEVLVVVGLTEPARALVALCHALTGGWLVLLAASAPALLKLARFDVWGTLPGELWGAPAAAVLASAAFLFGLDRERPVWARTAVMLAAPVVSGVASLALR